MADIIPFPERKFTPPPKGYCGECRAEFVWPRQGDWPKACPECGASPFWLTSWPPEPPATGATWFPDLTS